MPAERLRDDLLYAAVAVGVRQLVLFGADPTFFERGFQMPLLGERYSRLTSGVYRPARSPLPPSGEQSSPGAAIDAESGELTYADGTVVVKGIDLTIPEGEFFGFLGANGAGKTTTTIKTFSTLLSPTAGTITVNGFDVRDDLEPCTKRAVAEAMDVSLLSKGGRYEGQSTSGNSYEGNVIGESCSDWQQRSPKGGCKHLRRIDHDVSGPALQNSRLVFCIGRLRI